MQDAIPPVFWTPHNTGHWIVTRTALIQEVQEDSEHFSQREVTAPYIPSPYPMLITMDPPQHTETRKVIMPALNKTALQNLEEEARLAARRIVEEIAPRDECEFVSEVSNVLPIVVFLQELLARIPDFAIKPGTWPVMVTGAVNSVSELHLIWEPMR